jgi:hypothetical protein
MDPTVIGILGTALSALIAAISYCAKTRHEHRRATRTVLFYLLELHHILCRINFGVKQFPADYVERCKTLLTAKDQNFSQTDIQGLIDGVTLMIRQFGMTEIEALASEIAEPFAKALVDLSREDPILAFEIRGKDGIAKVSKILRSSTLTATTISSNASKETLRSDRFLTELDDFSREVVIKEIARCIRSVAWHCDILTHVRVLRLLRHASQVQTIADIDAHLSSTIDDILKRAAEFGIAEKSS